MIVEIGGVIAYRKTHPVIGLEGHIVSGRLAYLVYHNSISPKSVWYRSFILDLTPNVR